jgi:hypothetical protein
VVLGAAIVAWCARHFDDAPPVVNLLDPALTTRASLIARLRTQGWSGSVIWVPISFLATGVMAARKVIGLLTGNRGESLGVWSVLRPRRYDTRLSSALFDAVGSDAVFLRTPAKDLRGLRAQVATAEAPASDAP